MLRDRLLSRKDLCCDDCGSLMLAGDLVLCEDGYTRTYGEFVLSEDDDLHEGNWPLTHAECNKP